MKRPIAFVASAVMLGAVLAACSDDTPACAAPADLSGYGNPSKPSSSSGRSYTRPNPPSTRRSNSWTNPRPTTTKTQRVYIPQPVPVYRSDGWRMYPGYPGYYAPGMYPPGYVDHYHCRPVDRDDD